MSSQYHGHYQGQCQGQSQFHLLNGAYYVYVMYTINCNFIHIQGHMGFTSTM